MYNPCVTATAAGCSLAATGLDVGWSIVAATTLLFTGLAFKNIVPRRRRQNV